MNMNSKMQAMAADYKKQLNDKLKEKDEQMLERIEKLKK